ncbi:MAG TPA: GDSL-type esterase/lipase family protein [Polyangia bacterium]|nr:GDSL-type esterase/lipase family protein [Polyangia bacterium]
MLSTAACSGGGSGSPGTGGSGSGGSGGAGGAPDASSQTDVPASGSGGAGGTVVSGSGGGSGGAATDATGGDDKPDGGDASDGPATSNAWTGTWASSPQSCGGNYGGQTMREIVHTSIAGTSARVRLSNAFGNGPLQVQDVHIAQRTTGASIDPATDKALTFDGKTSVTVAAGTYAVSDGADFAVKAVSDLAVSFFVVSHNGVTCHQSGFETNYTANGNMVSAAMLNGGNNTSYYFLSNVDVLNPAAEGAVVTLGASITDGYISNNNDNKRWPNDLAVRLVGANRVVGVLNQGISGDGVANAVKRFDRDVLSQPNVKWVIFSDNPINDLGNFNPPAQTEIDQIKTMMTKARAMGIKWLCSTLTPFQGANYWAPEKEPGRDMINAYIRGANSGCDGIVDQDTATHDPAMPNRYLPSLNAGDSLHPNEAGLQAIADAVDLALFK